ncbi:unnamed protein product [Chrysoparadoxa australica]
MSQKSKDATGSMPPYATPSADLNMGQKINWEREVIDLDLEASDPLALHEVTLQFAGFRSPKSSMPQLNHRIIPLCHYAMAHLIYLSLCLQPQSIYLTYQFYTCAPTRTERMVLRPNATKHYEEDSAVMKVRVLVRERNHGRDEPSLALRHSIDTSLLQPFESIEFARYLAEKVLYIDVWDGDGMIMLGTAALPLRSLLRQQKAVSKMSCELEVIAPAGGGEAGASMSVSHGHLSPGPVLGLLQVRARPLSEVNPELGKIMSSTTTRHKGYSSTKRKTRGQPDGDSIGYDELMLLVKRFRGSVKGRVKYRGALLHLLDVPSIRSLEIKLVTALSISDIDLEQAFKQFERQKEPGWITIEDAVEIFGGMGVFNRIRQEHVKLLLLRMDHEGTGKISLCQLQAFVKTRQATKSGEHRLQASLASRPVPIATAFGRFDSNGDGCLTPDQFESALHRLPKPVFGLDAVDMRRLIHRFDADGSGLVSISEIDSLCDVSLSPFDIKMRRILVKAEANAEANGRKGAGIPSFPVQNDTKSDAGKPTCKHTSVLSPHTSVLSSQCHDSSQSGMALSRLRHILLSAQERDAPIEETFAKLDTQVSGEITLAEMKEGLGGDEKLSIFGKTPLDTAILLTASQQGVSLGEAFGVFDKDGSGTITLDELQEALKVFIMFITQLQLHVALTNHFGQLALLAGFDQNGDGVIDLHEFMALLGRDYSEVAVAEAKLRKILHKAEDDGTSLEAAFGAFDTDKSGKISLKELSSVLGELGITRDMSQAQVELVMHR